MAPNLTVNPPACSSIVPAEQNRPKSPDLLVRLEAVMRHVYCELVGDDFLIELPTLNAEEKAVLVAFRRLVAELRGASGDQMYDIVSSVHYTPETVDDVFEGVSNELFCRGISWGRIVAFAVFAGELAQLCVQKNEPSFTLDAIFDTLLRFAQENLERWIYDHGGWDAFIDFAAGAPSDDEEETPASPSPVPTAAAKLQQAAHQQTQNRTSWARSIFHNTIRVLGTLAQLSSLIDETQSFAVGR